MSYTAALMLGILSGLGYFGCACGTRTLESPKEGPSPRQVLGGLALMLCCFIFLIAVIAARFIDWRMIFNSLPWTEIGTTCTVVALVLGFGPWRKPRTWIRAAARAAARAVAGLFVLFVCPAVGFTGLAMGYCWMVGRCH
jgi:hypothetical protein